MTAKSLLFTGALAMASLAYGKSYDIVLSSATTAGKLQLKAGEYSVKVENGSAIFTDRETSKQFTTPVTVKTADKKFGDTAVDTTNEGGSEHIHSIVLGGSNTELDFAE